MRVKDLVSLNAPGEVGKQGYRLHDHAEVHLYG